MTTPTTAILGDPTGARAAAVMIKYAAPAEVLDAPVESLFNAPRLPCNFADRRMEYPVHTKAAAWTSAAGYLDTGGTDNAVVARLRESFVYHRLPATEWSRLAKIANDSQPPTQEPARYILADERKYPADTPEQVKAASDYFHKYANQFDPDTRRKYAVGLLEAAEGRLDAAFTRRLEAEAGFAAPAPTWTDEFDKRASMTRDAELREALAKVADNVKAAGFEGGRFRNAGELAELLRQVDRRMGWDFPDPLTGLTGETPSTARAKLAKAVEASNGDWYAVDDLDRLPNADFSAVVGGSPVVSRAAKIAALRNPRTATLVSAALEDFGITPVSRAKPRTDWVTAGSK